MTALPLEPGSRVLVVAPYAPYRDGIAAYAVQQVQALRKAGHHVEVLSPKPSAAHHHLDLHNPREMIDLARLARVFDRVIVHFHPDVFFPQPATFQVRLVRFVALGAALRSGPPATMVLHEIDDRWGQATDISGRAARFMLQSFDSIEVHYGRQGDQLVDHFGVDPARVHLVEHGAHFVARTSLDQASARALLDIAADDFVFLCIGFVAEHKGFDRAVTALQRLSLPAAADRTVEGRRARLDIVGAPSTGSAAAEVYALELESLVRATPGAGLHLGYVSDTAFDRWIIAADVVVLPYRHIWSSSVAERAALFERPVIATDVGGLGDQLGDVPGAVVVGSDAALAGAMADALVAGGVAVPGRGSSSDGGEAAAWDVVPDGAHVMAEVRRRADARRGYAFAREPAGPPGGRPRVAGSAGASPTGTRGPVDPRSISALRRIGPLARPLPVSARPGVGAVKRMQRRLFNWELEPVIGWVDEIRRATQQAVEATATAASPEDPPPSA